VAHWPLDEGGGQAARNEANRAKSGRIRGATWTQGRFGGALSFDGKKAHVRLAPRGSGYMHESFTERTASVWFRAERHRGKQVLLEEGGYVQGMSIRLSGRTLQAAVRTARKQATVEAQLERPGAWYHVAFVFDRGSLRLYVDGRQKAEGRAPYDRVGTHIDEAGLGGRVGSDAFADGRDGHCFGGLIDEVRIYGRALSAEEVRQLAGGL
jgi:hypothetical protein